MGLYFSHKCEPQVNIKSLVSVIDRKALREKKAASAVIRELKLEDK